MISNINVVAAAIMLASVAAPVILAAIAAPAVAGAQRHIKITPQPYDLQAPTESRSVARA
jgi:hypothetical protein